MILTKLAPRPDDDEHYGIREEDLAVKVVFTEERLKKHPSIQNIEVTYNDFHQIYNIHSFNDVNMAMQSINCSLF